MKKLQTTIKTIFLVVIILVMAQACIPTAPVGGNPTPSLSGKIKNYKIKTTFFGEFENYLSYSANGLVNKIYSPLGNSVSLVSYEPNKVIIRDSINNTTGNICFLQSGTVLLDSIYTYSNGSITNRIVIERDVNSNIVRILENDIVIRHSFVYSNNNIISYVEYRPSSGTYDEFTKKIDLVYDNARTIKSNINNILFLENILDNIDIFGISLGNTSNHPIVKAERTTLSGSGNSLYLPVTNYTYTTYTNNIVEFYVTPIFQNENDTIYYSNKYY